MLRGHELSHYSRIFFSVHPLFSNCFENNTRHNYKTNWPACFQAFPKNFFLSIYRSSALTPQLIPTHGLTKKVFLT